MRKVKKLFAFLLSAQMLMFSLPAAVSAAENASSDGVQTEFGGFVDGGEQIPDVASLLPMDEYSRTIYIDHSDPTADQEGFTVREALKNITYNEETVKILYAFGEYDSDEYKSIGLDDTISLDGFHSDYDSSYGFIQEHYDYYYFIVGTNADDQLNNAMTKKYRLTINVKTAANDFADNVDFELLGDDNNKIDIDDESQAAWLYTYNGLRYDRYYFYQYISETDYDNNKSKSLKMTLPSGYTSENVTIYNGSVYNEDYLENAADITSDILGSGYTLKSRYNDITAVITMEDGSKQFIIMYYGIQDNKSGLSYSCYGNSSSGYIYKESNLKNQVDYACKIVMTNSFDNILTGSLNFNYYNEDEGILYSDASDKIDFACTGYFKSLQEINAAGKQNMKDTLFSSHYVDFSESDEEIGYVNLYSYGITKVYYRTVLFTAIDVDGKIYNIGITAARYDKIEEQPVKELEPDLSGDTYLDMYRLYKQAGGTDYYNKYKVSKNDDSYYRNGYQTLFILNDDGTPVADGTVIYPYYYPTETANIFRSGDRQISGQTPVEFHSGETLQYSASAENGTNLGNYWVTFVTQHTGGAKLFVNGMRYNDEGMPEREIYLDNEHGFYHDIFVANIGDEKLEGITVTLENATGVALDPYWTVTDTSVKSLNPFTKTYNLDNIAKIRLVPENEDEITEISGTLKITTSNGGSVSINLTGIAGAPKIVTVSLKNGVKYVPYSSLIQTDNMNSDINVAFKVVDGKLPEGLKIDKNGELFGIPEENGIFTFTVQASCALNGNTVSDTAEYTIYIADNSDENVDAVNEDDQGYTLKQKVSKNIKVYYSETSDNASAETPYAIDSGTTDDMYDYFGSYSNVNIKRIELDSDVFCSEGDIGEFQKFYIDGQEVDKENYYLESGSTKITVTAQTFKKAMSNGVHTLAAEFRDGNGELKRSAQNVYLEYIEEQGSGGSGGNNSGISNNGGTINPDVSYGDGNITAKFNVVDETGAPISGIMLELHSTPKYATTDKNGVASFNNVEFGKHTLYIKSLTTGKKVSASFTFKEGEEFSAAGNVITLKENDTVYITARFNGESISVTAEKAENVGSGAASLLVADKAAGSQGNVIAVLIVAAVTVTAFIVIRKRSDRKYM